MSVLSAIKNITQSELCKATEAETITQFLSGVIIIDIQISSGQAKNPTNRNTWKKVNTNKKVFESGG